MIRRFGEIMLILSSACILTVGCASKQKHEANREQTAAEKTVTKLDNERDAYVKQAQSRIDSIEKSANDLESNSAKANKVQSKKMQNASDDIKALTDDARKELADVKSAAPQNWLDEKRDVERAIERAESTYSNAASLVR
jgi:hypothetical protein